MSFPIRDNVSAMSGVSLWFVGLCRIEVRSFVTVRSLVSKYSSPVASWLKYRVSWPGGASQASELACMDAGMVAMSGQSGSRSEVSSELEESGGMMVAMY
jgi:hypothetical protein